MAAPKMAEKQTQDQEEGKTDKMMAGEQGPGLGSGTFAAPLNAPGRLLEYNVDVTYRTKDIIAGRSMLFDVAARRGFLMTSSASAKSASMQVRMAVRSSELLDTLKELDRTGDLVEESINVIDHTENDYGQTLKAKREEIRNIRRNQAMIGDAAARNWAERDAALERSEDAADAAKLEKWRIQDRVNWATVTIHLDGPDLPAAVQVPTYRNAFVGLLNLLLWLVYASIYVLPFAAVIGLIIWKKNTIVGIFRRKNA